MNILIAYASKYGSTKEIAEHIALILRREGLPVEVKDAEAVASLHPYAAVIIGSALYFDNWLPAATELLESFQDELAQKPVWLFSSGITGEGDFRENIEWYYPEVLELIIKTIKPKDITLFGGKVDAKELELSDWLINPGLRVETGDYRNWKEIEAWAVQIGNTLNKHDGVALKSYPYLTKEDAQGMGDILKID